MQLAKDHDFWIENELRGGDSRHEQTREIHEHYQFNRSRLPKYVARRDRQHSWNGEAS